jgi:2'-5' RNA ligase
MNSFPERMSDHWWWRPGVRPGRRVLVWHILLHDQPDVRALAAEYQGRLDGIGGLDPVPAEWLHLTTQIVGFEDEVGSAEVRNLTAAAAERLRPVGPVTVDIGESLFHSEAVVLGVRPPGALDPIRHGIRAAMAETAGIPRLDDGPGWEPHVSVAYSNAEEPAGPIREALRSRPAPRPATVRDVHLVAQARAGHLYRWERIATVALGGPG